MDITKRHPQPWTIHRHKTCHSLKDALGRLMIYTRQGSDTGELMEHILSAMKKDEERKNIQL